jgi:hypothetical protein
MLHRGSRVPLPDQLLGRRMNTGLQDKASSPGSPANTDGEFAAALAARLAAKAERFHKAAPGSPAGADDDFAKSLAAKLAERSERLRAQAASMPPWSDFSAPGVDPRETTDRLSSLLASIRVGHVLAGTLLLMLLAAGAFVAVWGLSSSEPVPSSHIEQAKPVVPRAADMTEKAPPPAAPPAVSPAPVLAPALTPPSSAKPAEPPPASSAPQTPAIAPPAPAPLKAEEIRELQGRLKALGFDPGPADGAAGPMTLSAVRKYAEARALAKQEVTRDLLVRLRSELPPKK